MLIDSSIRDVLKYEIGFAIVFCGEFKIINYIKKYVNGDNLRIYLEKLKSNIAILLFVLCVLKIIQVH